MLNNLIDFLEIALPYLFPLLGVLAGAYLGYFFGARQIRTQKRLESIERQLREFYSPMIGCLKKIRAKSELRFEIEKASNLAWQKICKEHPKPFLDHEKHFEPFRKSILYDNRQLRKELIPLYDKMVSIFTDKLYLAESSTKKWYSELCRFVELWHRWLAESISAEVIQKLDHTEERLKPFYQDLENQLEKLRNKLLK